MSMTGDTVLDRLAYFRMALDELKSKQTVGGDSTVVRKNQSPAVYDQSGSVSGLSRRFIFQFTADRQAFGLADLSVDVAIDSPDNPADFYDEYYLNIFQEASDPATPFLTTWIVDLYKTASGTHTFYLKATVMSVDTGSVA
jgi:hypothetical protein